jgi:hypothetical protein
MNVQTALRSEKLNIDMGKIKLAYKACEGGIMPNVQKWEY